MEKVAKVQAVYKYKLFFGVDDHASIKLPAGAKVLDIRSDSGKPTSTWLWVMVNPMAKEVKRTFRVAGTGQKLTGTLQHIKTEHHVLYNNTTFVWHYFEVIDETV